MLMLACALSAPADTIHLKNGRLIYADRVRQATKNVEYDIGDNSYAIPKSVVDHVESGGAARAHSSSGQGASDSATQLPAFVPNNNLDQTQLPVTVVKDGRIDDSALESLERWGSSGLLAAGYFEAGKHELERGHSDQARGYFTRALSYAPGDAVILTHYAALLVNVREFAEAASVAQRAVRVDPNSADAYAVLGFAQFGADHSDQAVRSWRRSLQLRPDALIRQYLDKAERELKAESDFSERETGHFTLRYEGKQTSENFRRELMETLESNYQDLSRQLSVVPRNSIAVVLYTEEAFFDVTQAPSWSAAVNDGKLRIPIRGMTSITPELAGVLHHELAHSFINDVSRGRAPQWLHEGIAQLVEPRDPGAFGQRLGQVFRAHHGIPFNILERSFTGFSGLEARMAYDESLAAAAYIRDTFGMDDLRRILERIGEGDSPEAALRTTIHADYASLETEIGNYLKDKYGE